jgi:hypothetical protein
MASPERKEKLSNRCKEWHKNKHQNKKRLDDKKYRKNQNYSGKMEIKVSSK